MRIHKTLFLCVAFMAASRAFGNVAADTVVQTKTVENRNVMLNAEDADQPRQIPLGLPAALTASIFENILPVSYYVWPVLPNRTWMNDVGTRMSVMSLTETVVRSGDLGYSVDSYQIKPDTIFSGAARYSVNHFGRNLFSVYATSPLGKGWSIMGSTHHVLDPGTFKTYAYTFQTEAHSYKAALYKTSADKNTEASLHYQYASFGFIDNNYGPFVFVGNGDVSNYHGFRLGIDSYFPDEAENITYKDYETGEQQTRSIKDLSTTRTHQVMFNFSHNYDDGRLLRIASKYKSGDANVFAMMVSNIVDNDRHTYFLSDGSQYVGEKLQNRYMAYSRGFEHSWLTTAEMTGQTVNNKHNWRIGANVWWNRSGIRTSTAVMAHEDKKSPQLLYKRQDDGRLMPSWNYNTGGEYYDGHELKTALYLNDDWQLTSRFLLSAGARLQWFKIGGCAANNTRFGSNHFTPSAILQGRYTLTKGVGLTATALYLQKRRVLENYGGKQIPDDIPINFYMNRIGAYWNNSWLKLTSELFFIKRTNSHFRTQFYRVVDGKEETVTVPIVYDIQTTGWITDALLTPFRGFSLHCMLTIQNPIYKDFLLRAVFSDGEQVIDVSNNILTDLSQLLLELDPSYQIKQWRFWLSFRYLGKRYLNKTNSLYYKPRWETFGGIDFTLNPKVRFSLNVVNILNQKGPNGRIPSSDLLLPSEAYKYENFPMAGGYIRPFETQLICNIRF